jgi:methionine-rich copper-binding protein CopC
MDVRFMWDATNLYVRVMVTDNMHYNVTAPGLNAYNNDSLEFYINAHDNAAGGFTNYSTQDQFYIMANGALGGAAGNIGSTTAQVVAWTDPTFDPTGTNQVNGGNYGLMVTYKWVGTAGGQLGFTTAPAAGATMRLGAGANDADITFARHAHAISQSYTGTGALTYNNQSTWYSSMLVATNNSPTVAITSPTSPSSVGLGATVNLTAQAAVGNPGDTIAGVQFFDGGVAIGAGIHTTDGIYTFGWNTTGASVGLHNITAVVTDSAARTAASAPATVVNVIGAPTISITAPTSPYQAYAPANVNLVASVNNPGGTITGVTFYDGGLFLAAATNPNDGIWTFGWATVPVGTHSVTAVVTNNFGLTGTSAAVSIEIDPTAPTIAMTASPTQAYAPADVVLTASATNGAPGTVTGVSFFDGTASHVATFDAGTGTWTFGWATVPVGTYSVVAVATDNGGLSATSAAVSVEIDSLIAPTVAITSPASGMIAGQGWKIVLTASTADGTPGTVTGVAMYDGAVKLGDAVLAAGVWTYTWDTSAASVTGHSITAVATDSMGLTATSAPVAIAMRLGGDGNNDGIVDGEDYGVWQAGYGHGTSFATGDYNGDGVVDGEDYGAWQSDYGRTSGLDDIVAASTADQAMAVATMASAPRITATMPASGSTAAGVTTVTLTFDSNVLVGGAAVEVSGLATGKQAATAVYDAATKTLTLTFASALPADAYTVRVIGSFVVGADDGAALDGAGTGTAGSDAQLQFTAE